MSLISVVTPSRSFDYEYKGLVADAVANAKFWTKVGAVKIIVSGKKGNIRWFWEAK